MPNRKRGPCCGRVRRRTFLADMGMGFTGLALGSMLADDGILRAAEAANPGTTALDVELENENGALVYEVELDNGLEVMIDAANGNILGTEVEEVD